MMEALLDPTGRDEWSSDATLTPRPATLQGLTVGLLDNTKVNASALLSEIAAELRGRYRVAETRLYKKDYFGTPVKKDLLEQLTAECDVIVTAVGDCGSCSAATVADGVLLERAGVPTVSICSDAFVIAGSAMARLQGFPGFEFVTVKHPVASLDAAQLHERAINAIPDVVRILGVEA
jgi:hypothetical protein